MCNFPRDDTYNAYENFRTVGQLWILAYIHYRQTQ